ncbi:MAG: zinc-binding dehydrogenase [Arenicellales bacterium]|nr:zinc-binding dehydrogenase [Arenicellales bacterium]
MALPNTMKGVQLTGHGGPEKLIWNDAIPTPQPGAGDALVKVLAAGVNNTDINTRIGWYSKDVTDSTEAVDPGAEVEAGGWSGALSFPLIQGSDLCGKVVALGESVTNVSVGMRVTCPTNQPNPTADAPTRFLAMGSDFDGAFAQYCVVAAHQLHDVSAAPLTDIEIAAIPCAHGTAFNLLSRADVVASDQVLVTGASGGVGIAAVELAKLRGAHVTALASQHKADAVRTAGADVVLDRSAELEVGTFTVAIDVVGGAGWSGVLDALKPGGRYAISGAIAGPVVEADLRTIYLNDLTIYGCSYTPHAVFSELIALVNGGYIKPLISKTYPLSDICRAQEDFSTKKFPGKIVLVPPHEETLFTEP